MEDITIRAATADDAAALAEFAERVFDEVFSPGNDEGDMASYMTEAFGPRQQRAEITEPGAIMLVAEDATGALAGYLHITASRTPACVTAPAVELKRLYVDPRRHSRGLGKRLLDDGIARAKAAGATRLWLGVWEHNVRAQKFYQREGFTRAGEHIFLLGSDPQTDWIMQRTLA
jgi:ribosomal protein S18 acetylase RimI-like enzyme